MISKNKAYTLSIFLTILMVFCTYISGYANENSDPVFIDGARAIRSIAENTPAGVNIGAPVAATDADGDTLTYSKGWLDGMAFTVDSATGQIQTKAALDYETQKLYSFAIFADDGNGGKTVTSVTINVTDVDETPANSAPVFTDGTSATRSIAENTASDTNIGTAIAATDADNDTLTYTLEGTDASSFSIVSTSGQLQTKAALDYEAKSSYSVRITVSDSKLTDTIDVTINVSDVDENRAPSFAEGTSTTRSIAENTAADTNIGSAVAATDPDDDTLTYTLGGADAAAFSINNTTGQLQTRAALDYEAKSSYSVRITVSDSKLTDSIDVTINVTDVDENRAPSFTEGNRATRSVAENTGSGQDIGSAVSATDPDDDTLTYTLGGTDASSFSINSTTGQLQTSGALDYETKSSYSVRITVSDSKLTDTIDVTINVTDVDENRAPSFTEGNRATRSVAENTGSGQDIGSAVAATDPDDDTLTYTLGGTDAASFSIVSTSGQLQTNAALDYEAKSSYSVRITVSDSKLTDTIDVTINVTDVDENRAPSFTEGNTATRSVAENTGSGQDIGSAVGATDPDTDDTLTYTLGGTDASSFSIVSTSGQLQTSAALNYESKSSYSVSVSVSDGNGGSDSIDVTINVTNVNEAPSFANSTATRSIAENTAANTNIGTAISATDPDTGDTLTYTLGGTDAAAFRINSTNGRLKTRAALDYETKSSYSVRITVSDSELTDTIDVTINVTDVDENRAPSFTDGSTTTRSVAENTGSGQNIGSAVAATDPDDDTLTYTLGGTDAAMFRINSTNGQLKTRAALDYETKTSYSVRITVSDSELTDTIDVTVNVTDVDENRAPSFTDGSTTTRSIAENTGPGQDIGSAVAATDPDDDTLTYILGGTDAAMFSIVSTSGQLQTKAALDYEAKSSYSVRITVSDAKLTDTIDVRINVTDVSENRAPAFTAGASTTRSVAENTAADTNIGSAISATDPDDDTLTYTLGGTDAASFSIVSTSGQLQTNAALDYETKTSYSVRITVSDSELTDTIDVTINVTDVDENRAPSFADGTSTTRSIAENTAADTNIGSAISATDPDDDTLTYTLGGTDAASFSIVSTSGQLQTNAALNYESKSSYSVSVSVSDGNGGNDSIPVTISVTDVNEAPSFATTTATRSIAENTASDEDIGSAVTATDPDTGDTLTYSLSGTDASSFSIVSTSGQLQTNAALDYETKTTYSVRITASDSELTDSIDVTINVTDVDENRAPTFTAGSSTTRSIAENTNSGVNIGSPVAATDADTSNTLTYTLGGTDAAMFGIVSTSGQLQTKAALNYESKSSYSVTVSVSDGNGGSDSIPVTISVTDVNEAPSFASSTATRSIAENTGSGQDIGSAVGATDPDAGDTLTYTLGGADAAAFSIVSTSGQLQTNVALDYETKSSYSVTVTATDDDTLSDTTTVTISVTDVNEAPNFATTTATRSIAENTAADTNIGAAITATDVDANTTLTYTLGGTDAASFSIVSTSGQLQTSAALDYETKTTYSVRITVSDSELTDTIDVTINVTDVDENRAPAFAEGTSTTRSIAENTAADTNIGSAVSATDPDDDTLTYTVGGADAAAFSINSTTGQLQASAALDYETKTSYSVTVSVSDGNGGSDSIPVTISVTDVNEAPSFANSTATRSIAENTAAETNIGAAITATDVDANTTLTYTLGGTDADSFSIVSTSGQLQTNAALDYETKSSYSVTVTATDDDSLSDTTTVTISITDVNEAPSFATDTAARSIAENTAAETNIGAAITATDVDANTTLTYTLGGTDAASFSIVSTSGQLQTSAALDYETKTSYSVRITVSDSELTDTIDVTINVTDVDENRAPSFADGASTTRSVAENTAADTNIGSAVSATDPDTDDTLTYSLSGADAAAFSIDSTTGQLQTSAALDYETKTSYSVTITVSDSELTDTIDVTISVTNVNEAPSFATTTATRSIAENTAANTNIGAAITATDVDANTTLAYTLGGADAASFSIVSTSGQLQTNAALDHETKASYSVTVTATDGDTLSDTITVTITVTNVDEAPSFTEGSSATRSVAENTAADTNIGTAVAATDPDTGDTLTYTLGGTDAASFTINSTNGQLRTSGALDYETKTSYAVTITVSDSELTDTIDVTISVTDVNEAPNFATTTATRSIAENTAADTNIGAAITATDVDANTTLTYTLGGADAAAFSIVSTSGQLQTNAALDHETKSSYSVTITATDGGNLSDTITVTISVTDVNDAPNFATDTAIRSVAENTAADTNIGTAVAATDPDTGDTLTYTLGGTDAASFSIVSTSGQLRTSTALDYETKTSYSVRITVSDTELTDTIDVTINVTNVNEAPSFTAGSTATRTIAENTASGTNIGAAVTATDVDANTTLTYTLGGTDAATFSIVSTSGQLQTSAALNYETKTSYSVKISVADGSGGTDTIDVTINVTDVYEPIIHRTQQVQDAIVAAVPGVNHADYVTVAHLAAITSLDLSSESITSLKSGDFNELPALTHLYLSGNSISNISVLSGLTALIDLDLSNNSISNISALTDLTGLTGLDLSFNSISNISALTDLTKLTDLDLGGNSISDISALEGLTKLTYLDLDGNSISDISKLESLTKLTNLDLGGNSISDISALAGLTKLTTLSLSNNSISDISTLASLTTLTDLKLSGNPISDYGPLYRLLAAIDGIEGHPGLTLDINIPPVFTEGTGTTRSIAENTASGQDIGTPVAATDVEDDTLTYSLEGADADSFSIDTATGQLRTSAALDYETKTSYSVTVSVSDGNGGTDTIAVTINITDINDGSPPSFTEGTSTTRSVAENTASGQDIGTAVAATDADNDTLTYSLGGTDAASFSINTFTGQLRTSAALDYETKTSYSVTVSVSDGNNGTDTIAVTINVTNINEGLVTPINRRTQEVQDAIVAAVPGVDNADDVTSAHLTAITYLDLGYKGITSLKSGDFSGLPSLTELDLSGNSISNISVLSGLTKLRELNLSDNSISNISALRGLTKLTMLYLKNNSISNVSALEGLTALTYLDLSGNPISNYDPLRRLLAAIDEIEEHPGLRLDINIPPVFTDGTSTRRYVAEYTPSDQDIGDPVSATDANKDYLTYSLEGTDADSFSINSSTGQLQTNAALRYQTKRSYSVTVSVDDGYEGGTDTIAVTIYVTDVNEASITPVNQRTQEVQDAIVGKVSGVDNADDVTPAHLAAITDLRLRSEGITSLKSGDFSGLSNLANLDLSDNSISNISVLSGLTKLTELNLSDNIISNISQLSSLTKLTTLYLERNAISNVSVLERLTKLTYLSLESNPISDYAPLRRLKKANPTLYISINIENNPPQFTQGSSTTRAIAEDAISYTDIGEPISATDTDPYDTLTYSFAPEPFGTSDADIFGIDSSSGQLYTYEELDYEEQTSYTVVVDVSDGNGGMDRITVTIYVRDVAGAAPSLETSTIIPNQTGLLTNFPNPFNPETWIPYQLAKPAEVTLTIYDIRGVVVRELKLGHQPAGFYHNRSRAIHWDGRNAFGEKVATGVYFYTLKAGDFTATRKLLIRK